MAREDVNLESPSFKALVTATEMIYADIRSNGPWARRVAAARSPEEGIIGNAYFDAPTRKPTFLERLRKREPRPVTANVDWIDDTSLNVCAFGLPNSEIPFSQVLTVQPEQVQEAANELVNLIDEALSSIDPQKTESIKVMKLSKDFAQAFPGMVAQANAQRYDPWNR